MAKEIERKFLVKNGLYEQLSHRSIEIRQAYLSTAVEATVRVRIAGDKAWITVKGRNVGASRDEWEYPIPYDDALQMLDRCALNGLVEKTRYLVEYADRTWEVDRFKGRLAPLVLAEVELSDESENVDLPPFVGEEVTGDPRYYNSNLADKK